MNRLSTRLTRFFGSRRGIVLAGGIIGLLAAGLEKLGNPPGTGLCIVCFERDIAGALGLHRAYGGQYIRPEIIGLVLGATLAAVLFREFKSRGGSAPLIRFFLGMAAMIGAISFMGCPIGAILRLAGGNLTAPLAVAALILGVYMGVLFIRGGFDLGPAQRTHPLNGWVLPLGMLGLLLILLFDRRADLTSAPYRSWIEPSSLSAPVLISLAAGGLVGFMAQRTRFCTIGAARDVILMRNGHYLWGVSAMFLAALTGNLILGQFRPAPAQSIEAAVGPLQYLWSTLGAVLAGLAFTLAGGCAGRKLFLAGEGDGDAAVFIIGMLGGAALTHNFALIGRPACGAMGDIRPLGAAAIVLGLILCLTVGFTMRRRWGD